LKCYLRAGATDFVVVRLIFERAFNARQLKFSAKMLGCEDGLVINTVDTLHSVLPHSLSRRVWGHASIGKLGALI